MAALAVRLVRVKLAPVQDQALPEAQMWVQLVAAVRLELLPVGTAVLALL
jgi:hypothetical protein